MSVCSKAAFNFPQHRESKANIKLPNMTEPALSDERKPLIFPPFHHQSGGEEVAVGAQTDDDVICNRGPPVSGENCFDSPHVAEYLPQSSAFSWKINSRGSTDNLQRLRKYFLCQPHRSGANICIRRSHSSLQLDGKHSEHQLCFNLCKYYHLRIKED